MDGYTGRVRTTGVLILPNSVDNNVPFMDGSYAQARGYQRSKPDHLQVDPRIPYYYLSENYKRFNIQVRPGLSKYDVAMIKFIFASMYKPIGNNMYFERIPNFKEISVNEIIETIEVFFNQYPDSDMENYLKDVYPTLHLKYIYEYLADAGLIQMCRNDEGNAMIIPNRHNILIYLQKEKECIAES